MLQQGRNILDFVQNNGAMLESGQKASRVRRGEVAFKGIVETDVVRADSGLVQEKGRFA
jgi:hypothetical protein